MGQTGGTVQAVTRPAPDVAALILAVPAFAHVAIVLPRGGRAAGPTSRTDLASRAGSTGRTDARVARDAIHASGPAGARIARALVDVDTAVRAGETGRAFASEPIDTVYAFTAIQTRHRLTIVHVAPAVQPLETLAADAAVIAVDRVHAGSAVRAGTARARRRRRDVAGRSLPAVRAMTREAVAAILAGTTVPASARLAVTTAQRARFALPAAPADACEVRHTVHAGTVVATGLCHAFVHVLIAKVPVPTLPTDALEGIKQIDARAAVQAGIAPTVVDVLVAVHAGVTGIADASSAAASTFTAARGALAAAAVLLVARHAELLRVMRGRIRTVLALPLYRAVTIIVGLRVEARRRVAARIRAAVIAIDLALVAGEAHGTHALVSVHQIPALAAILTRLGRALVDVDVAVLAGVAGGAAAVIVVHQVDAERAVLALADAVVDILRAVLAGEAAPASAPVVAGQIDAGERVLAGRFLERALVHVELTEDALPGGRAVTREAVLAVDADAAVLARLRGALVDVGRAVRPGETRGALAMRGLAELVAGRAVQAGAGRARIVDLLAGGPGEAVRARATVLIGRGVLARAAVLARLVGAAVVEVLVAQYTAPVGVADALPAGAVAVAVLAAWIRHALVAQLAAPAVPTLALAADVAVTVHGVAALLADGCLAIDAFPSLYTHFVPVLVAGVMAENVVSRSAEFGAGRIVVMIGALDSHPIRQVRVPPLMIESVPRGSWQDDAAVTRLLDYAGARLVPRLQDQRELPRPSEGKV